MKTSTTDRTRLKQSTTGLSKVCELKILTFTLIFYRKKRVSIQSQDKNKLSNSISQSKMNTEPKVVSTQTTISSTTVTAEVKPQQVQAQTPDHKAYVTEMRKELAEASTTTWSPGHNGHLLVRINRRFGNENVCLSFDFI